jgi:hypothetical protein
LGNEQVLRQAYKIAENKDIEGWVAAFTDDGTFTDESIGVTYGGPDGLPEQVGNYGRAFPTMQRVLAVPESGRITTRMELTFHFARASVEAGNGRGDGLAA